MADRETWNERYANKDMVWSTEPNRLFAELVADLAPGRALDLGCGEPQCLDLAERGWDVTAVDYSDAGIEKARKLAEHRGVTVDFRVEDVASIELDARQFDLVAVVFLHTGAAERDHWLPQAIDAVADDGTFLYIGHDPSNIESGVGGPRDPAVLPGADAISAALAGFTIERADIYRRPVGEDPGHGATGGGVALDTVVMARRGG
ncbi:MAG: class I SAM-dependent methyltransferase [Gammaproteobacteria bacterium]|nr:class I SAM-dependent methyltransferase [Gammaproteobacteria bacterium]